MRHRINPEFSEEQIEEIEDRVNNLVQYPLLILQGLLEEDSDITRGTIRSGLAQLEKLVEWVHQLRPEEKRYRK